MSRLTITQEKLLYRLLAMQQEVAEADLRREACPLLDAQLERLMVFAGRVTDLAAKLRMSLPRSTAND